MAHLTDFYKPFAINLCQCYNRNRKVLSNCAVLEETVPSETFLNNSYLGGNPFSMKIVKKLVCVAAAAGAACLLAQLVKTDKVQEWLYSGEREDITLAVVDKARLLGDLLGWPIHFVKALLP